MAVNKNFVVKNGLEVSDDLILANATDNMVGIGTSVPYYELHVQGGIGATSLWVAGVSTFTSDVSVTGVTTLASAGGITTVGGDLFVGGDLSVVGDVVYDEVTGRNLNITGVGTITRLNTTSLVGTSATISSGLYISGGELTVGAAFTVSQAGVVTATKFVGAVDVTGGNFSGVGTFSTLHVGTSGTVLAAVDSATISLGSGANPVTATLNGGSIPSIGLAIALGG